MARTEITAGEVSYVKAKDLEPGAVVEGKFIESYKSEEFDQMNHKIETDAGTVVVNGSGQLNMKMAKLQPGNYVWLTYEGMEVIQSGKRKGKEAHQWKVESDTAPPKSKAQPVL